MTTKQRLDEHERWLRQHDEQMTAFREERDKEWRRSRNEMREIRKSLSELIAAMQQKTNGKH